MHSNIKDLNIEMSYSSYSIRTHINQVEELKEEFKNKIWELERKSSLSENEKKYLEGCEQEVKNLKKKIKKLRKKEIKMNGGYDPLDDNINSFISSLYHH